MADCNTSGESKGKISSASQLNMVGTMYSVNGTGLRQWMSMARSETIAASIVALIASI